MTLLTILVVLLVIGVVLYLINTYIPMDAKIKGILNIVAVIFVVIWLLKASGALSFLSGINI